MAGVGRGRVIGTAALLARLVIAAGLGCMLFAAATALVLAEGAAAAGLGRLGALWAVAGFVAERLLYMARGRTAAGTPAPHDEQPARVPARQPPAPGWWTVLGVAADAPPATFEGAARRLLRQCHPDRWATAGPARRQEAEARTRAILQALAAARASLR